MAATDCTETSNMMAELYFEQLNSLGVLESFNQVPFRIQQRRNGFTPAMRCLTLLASQAQRCQRLTDWTRAHRLDSRLPHWMGGRAAPHPSTLSRTLAATDARTVEVLRREVLVPLTDQVRIDREAIAVATARSRLHDKLIEQDLADRVGRPMPPGEHPHRPVAVARECSLHERRGERHAADGERAAIGRGAWHTCPHRSRTLI